MYIIYGCESHGTPLWTHWTEDKLAHIISSSYTLQFSLLKTRWCRLGKKWLADKTRWLGTRLRLGSKVRLQSTASVYLGLWRNVDLTTGAGGCFRSQFLLWPWHSCPTSEGPGPLPPVWCEAGGDKGGQGDGDVSPRPALPYHTHTHTHTHKLGE